MEAFCFDVGDIFCILSFFLDLCIYIEHKRKDRLSYLMSPDSSTKSELKHTK